MVLATFKIKINFVENLFIEALLSIIIVSYNCKNLVSEAILSIYTYSNIGTEIIVVDNASSDGTVDHLESHFPEVKVISNAKNVGFSAANNQGFSIATGSVILLLNPDAKLINGDMPKALSFLDKNPKTILGPKILNPDKSLQGSVIKIPTSFDVMVEALFLSYFFKREIEEILTEDNYGLTGACLLLTRDSYKMLGGLDENLFWMDDMDFCYRGRKEGLNIKYFSEWSVVHLIGQSGKKNYKVSIANQLISKLKFFKKHNQYFNYFASIFFIQFHILSRIILFFPLTLFGTVYRSKFTAYCYTQLLFFKYIFTNQKQTF